MGLREVSTKLCAQLHVFAVQTISSFWWDLESVDKKLWPVASFWQCRLSEVFGWDLEKFLQKGVTSCIFLAVQTIWSFWMGLRKVSTKRCDQLHIFIAVQTLSSFWRDLEKFPPKVCPVTRFVRCGDYLKFLMGLGKLFTKKCAQLHVLFAVETISSFWWVLENFHKKVCPVTRFVLCGDYLKFLMGLGKIFTKKCAQLHVLFAVETILSFGWDLEKYRQNCVPSYTFCSLWRQFRFWMGLREVSTKLCAQLHVFAVQTISSFWWDLESVDKKLWPVASFWQCRISEVFGWDLEKFLQKGVTSCIFLAVQTIWSFWMGPRKVSTKRCDQLHILFQCRLS